MFSQGPTRQSRAHIQNWSHVHAASQPPDEIPERHEPEIEPDLPPETSPTPDPEIRPGEYPEISPDFAPSQPEINPDPSLSTWPSSIALHNLKEC